MATRRKRPPAHLTADSRRVWKRIAEDFDLWGDDAALLVLNAAMEARDRCEQARQEVAKAGLTVPTGAGGVKPHPAVAIERDARLSMIRALRELSLDSDYESARPPRIGGGMS